MKKPWKKWFMILDRLERELLMEFPPPPLTEQEEKLGIKPKPSAGERMAEELRHVRSTLRNLHKGEQE